MRQTRLMRRWIHTAVLGLTAALVLSACGTTSSTPAKPGGDEEKILAINFPGASSVTIAQNLLEKTAEIAEKDGWKVVIDDPEDDLNLDSPTLFGSLSAF